MKTIAILVLASAFCGSLAFDEFRLAIYGVEPGVACNKQSNQSGQHRVVVHFDSSLSDPDGRRVKRVVSINRGDSFDALPAYVHQDGNLQADPAIAANTATGDFFYAWMNLGVDARVQSKRTQWDCVLPPTAQGVNPLGQSFDRPWLAASPQKVIAEYRLIQWDTHFHVVQAGTPDASNPALINWGEPLEVFKAPSGTTTSNSAPVAISGDHVYLLVLQYVSGEPNDPNNQLRLFTSSDGGTHWDVGRTIETYVGWDQFVEDRSWAYSVCAEAGTGRVFVTYAKTFDLEEPMLGEPGSGIVFPAGKYQVLFSRVSNNYGVTWSAPKVVVNGGDYLDPENAQGYAEIDLRGDKSGYFHIGRVWSCVDGIGQVHAVWFDNRRGKYNTQRDRWRVYRSKSANGLTWGWGSSERSRPVSQADSIGGYGVGGTLFGVNHLPPGDSIGCDADGQFLYVPWVDTRSYDGGLNRPEIWFRKFDVNE
jgi:hypothetical protein